jgi:Bifunctional DNA primase/polymerase, N-terminal/Primase C terminal 1 (PriCT-1)/Protein of unknown function (DUF3987)
VYYEVRRVDNVHQVALFYVARGFSVIPIQPREKKPLITWHKYQRQRATQSEITLWWSNWPEANVGIVTGAISGVVVIDLDTAQAKTNLKELVPGFDFTKVPRSCTGKGWHLFFRHPGVSIPNRAAVFAGLDVRGDGGYVVAPPSIHPNGKQYLWEVPIEDELPELSPELLKRISTLANGSMKGAVSTIEGIILEGQRNATLTSLGGSMRRRGMSEASILVALQEENRTRCNPPLPDRDVEAIAKSIARYPATLSGEHLTPKPLCVNELGVTCSVDDEDEQRSPELATVPFPEVAWSGLFDHWREIVGQCTEAPLEFLWSSFLVNVGLMLGRNVWVESPQPLYPNFYVLLLGQTGDARKSTALWLARQLLKRVQDDTEIITGIVSTEGLFERLAKHDDTRALGYVDEFRSLLSIGLRQGTRDLLPKLNSLFYCPDQETIDRRKNPTTVIRPFFSLIGATAQDFVTDLITHVELSGGILNRFLMIAGEEQSPKAIASAPTDREWNSIAARLQHLHDRKRRPRRIVWSEQARELWTEFYVSWRNVRKTWDIRSQSLTARIHEHIQKIAVVYSALANEFTISAPTLATAIAIGEWLQNTILRLFENVGLDTFSKAELTVLKIVRERNRIPRRALQQIVSKKGINGKLFGDVLKTLEANGHCIELPETTSSGQTSKIIVYIPRTAKHQTKSETGENLIGVPGDNHAEGR